MVSYQHPGLAKSKLQVPLQKQGHSLPEDSVHPPQDAIPRQEPLRPLPAGEGVRRRRNLIERNPREKGLTERVPSEQGLAERIPIEGSPRGAGLAERGLGERGLGGMGLGGMGLGGRGLDG